MEKRLILLVEDNPDDVDLTLRALKKNNILNEIVVARDGVEALEYLMSDLPKEEELHPLPELVLLDLKLPKIDGLEVLKQIRQKERTKLLPVVILTSSNEERDLIESYNFGANSYIRKPVDFKEFTDAVQQLQMYWLLLNQPPPKQG